MTKNKQNQSNAMKDHKIKALREREKRLREYLRSTRAELSQIESDDFVFSEPAAADTPRPHVYIPPENTEKNRFGPEQTRKG